MKISKSDIDYPSMIRLFKRNEVYIHTSTFVYRNELSFCIILNNFQLACSRLHFVQINFLKILMIILYKLSKVKISVV